MLILNPDGRQGEKLRPGQLRAPASALASLFVYEIKITSHGHTFLCIPPSYTIHHVSTTYARKTHNSLATSVIEQWRNTTPLCCDEKSFQESFCQHKLGSGLDIGQELLKFPSCIKVTFRELFSPSSTILLNTERLREQP
ncbi:hypothetical protein HZ326_12786 [Fusarium oxysporum f. sp. albedinis]|nr:hypothetical protein HZ326_12786 [Fusarium oxysporum f. sp. albedinis]